MTATELNLAFAREVAGYPDAKWDHSYDIPVLTSGVDEPVFDGSRVGQRILPDYTKDWNAVMAEITKRGLNWGKGPIEGHVCFRVSCPGHISVHPGDCEGLARAVLDCVRAMRSQDA